MNYKSIITSLSIGLALTANAATISPFDWTDLCSEMTSPVFDSNQLALLTDNNEKTEVVTELSEPATVTFTIRENLKLSNYTITGDNSTVNGPKSWVVEGSADGTQWTKIQEQSNKTYNEPYWTHNHSLIPGSDRDNMP